jgi:hypothetical protein
VERTNETPASLTNEDVREDVSRRVATSLEKLRLRPEPGVQAHVLKG